MGCGSSTANSTHASVAVSGGTANVAREVKVKAETNEVEAPAPPPAAEPVAAAESAPESESKPYSETAPKEEEAPAPAADPAPEPQATAPEEEAAAPAAGGDAEAPNTPEEVAALREAVLSALGSSKDSASVLAALNGMPGVRTLDLSGASLDMDSGLAVAGAVKDSTSLKCLNMSSNELGSEGEEMAEALAALLKENKMLTELDISGIGLDARSANHIAMAVAANTVLLTLSLSNNPGIGSEGASVLGAGIDANTSVCRLSLAASAIGDDGVGYVAAALMSNGSIQYLDLSNNGLGEEGAKELSRVLCAQVGGGLPWIQLDLSGNSGIGDAGVLHLADSLEDPNASLQQLILRGCNVGDEGARALGELKESPLLKIDLRENGSIGDEVRQILSGMEKTEVLI